ncbi:hypothetical protein DL98DRAFT_660267 [Cadophora sp. DSE1049]|nr:hypothetical protein DL98DRAFT_660267 [Cadophora sp. DSE1049]
MAHRNETKKYISNPHNHISTTHFTTLNMANSLEAAAKKAIKPLIAQIVHYSPSSPTPEPSSPPFQYHNFQLSGLRDLGHLLTSLGVNRPSYTSSNPPRQNVLDEIDAARISVKTVRGIDINVSGPGTSTVGLTAFPRMNKPMMGSHGRVQGQDGNSTALEESFYGNYLPLGVAALIAPCILAIATGYVASRLEARMGWKEYVALWILLCISGLGLPDDEIGFENGDLGIWYWLVVGAIVKLGLEIVGKRMARWVGR